MEEIIREIIGNTEFTAPQHVVHSFNETFKKAVKIEWHLNGSLYEAVFYLNGLEYMAIFNSGGDLLEHKIFIPDDNLPLQIVYALKEKGELMNVIKIIKKDIIEYEIIYRNKSLERFVAIVAESGEILDIRQL